jgi:hypothetical protein
VLGVSGVARANNQKENKQKMPKYSTMDLIYEVFVAITSIDKNQFTIGELVGKINDNRRKRGEKTKVSETSVYKVLSHLGLPFNVRRTASGSWEKGTGPIRGVTNLRPDVVESIIQDGKIDAAPLEIDHWINLAGEATTRKAYICYPYRDNPLRRSYELLILLVHVYPKSNEKFAPLTPHEMCWGLEERTTRKTAMNACADWIRKCDYILYCLKRSDTPSNGMLEDLKIAEQAGIKVLYIEDELGYYPNLEDIMKKCGLYDISVGQPFMPTVH